VDAIAGWTSVMVSADKVDALLQKNTAVLERIRRIIERSRHREGRRRGGVLTRPSAEPTRAMKATREGLYSPMTHQSRDLSEARSA
jgi:hypothetical protein